MERIERCERSAELCARRRHARCAKAAAQACVAAILLLAVPLAAQPLDTSLATIPAHHAPAVSVESVRLTVADLDQALEFYTRVLPFKADEIVAVEGAAYGRLFDAKRPRLRVARLRLGEETLELVDWLSSEGRAYPSGSRSNDRWFQHVAIIVSDMDRAYAHLRAHGVRHVSPGPQTLPVWNPEAGGIRAFYFLDPEDHVLEILWFPPGKGNPRWQGHGDALFLGIDHTAIVVHDTEASLRFYRDALGLEVVGGSENYGAEQERLNAVFPARLRITTLRAPRGPGVELLEYVTPLGGLPYPAHAKPNDLVSWQTVITVTDVEALAKTWGPGLQRVSRGVVAHDDGALGGARSTLVRDPDGHLVHVMDWFDARATR